MKKRILGFMAALLLTTACIMNAQEFKIDGYINSGLGLIASNEKDVDPHFKAFGVDSEQNGYRLRLNGTFTNEAKNAGIRFRLQSQATLQASGSEYISLPYAYGWVSFLNNIFTLNAGIIEDSTWTTGDWWLASSSVGDFAGLGALLKVTPIDGLALGVGGYVINRGGGGSNNILNSSTLGMPADIDDIKLTFHGAYTMKDVFRMGLSFRTENRAGISNPETASEPSVLYGEFRYLGMKDLTAVAAISFARPGMKDFNTAGNITFSETFGYKIGDDINVGLNAVQFLYRREASTSPSLLFNLWGSYAFDKIVPRLDLVYLMNGSSTLVTNNTWHRKGFVNRPYGSDVNNLSVFSARPSVKINLDTKTFLEIGDMINYDFGKREGAYGDKKSLLSNVFYIDAKWSF
jgi:hypothetical protein